MTRALVGHTGFVGGNLLAQADFDATFNSSNAADIAGESFDTVVFSAAKAEKWRINQDPESDAVHIRELERILGSFRAKRLVLISTVDVYGSPVGVDEDTPVPEPGLHPYGLHRWQLENAARDRFDDVLVVRLPGLFGPGIKKNVVFDLLHDNNVERIHHAGRFQYYDLRELWRHIGEAADAGLDLVNLATEPVTTGEIAREVFGIDFRDEPAGVVPGLYDMRTRHAGVFGGRDGYLYGRDAVIARLADFVARERS
ncbi:hypothetical protein QT381_08100 [Galbitalea sp. SE-J8]|uniref:NAD-dependent epimerase/dehydratase family protein n=1 Tax=Galbitalea sp. SE-J8 TaxID=3054952 RepID=UPI00259CEE8A|nr:NAD-dependent epimerase/dehydratase family protein [Galbitalea sp. SE-J8]MDM4762967.1 hypothetical protein [Galbitalea sp. SE-J8]